MTKVYDIWILETVKIFNECIFTCHYSNISNIYNSRFFWISHPCANEIDGSTDECPLFYDDVLCWPPTPINSTHRIYCTIALQTLLNEYHVISEDGKIILKLDAKMIFDFNSYFLFNYY